LIVNVRKHIKTKARTTKRSLSLSLTQFTHERPTHTHTHTHTHACSFLTPCHCQSLTARFYKPT